ncbi:ABC transporter ATP-binding protein [Halalkalirubrum salinum]|uniref:ABC transporter ATP-binding protein n=1 Tax=Halalkalirubrum salinum TaxID=2563889 RepID=UPI0010FB01EF|nr:ABC transporter ATP-binding protein [Halalkalirubrum salinum]
MSLLTVKGLTTEFHTRRGVVTAVDDVDLTVNRGELVGLVGESGSGKTVLAESVVGLVEEPGVVTADSIVFDGQRLDQLTESEMRTLRGGKIAMVFQDPMTSLNPTISTGEQIAEAVRLHNDTGESISLPAELKRKIFGAAKDTESWRRAIELLEEVGIPEPSVRVTEYPHEFSGGMRQRVMISMALAGEPDLLIADEPTTALDVTVQAQILEDLKSLSQEFDTAILMITHDLAVVAETCDRVNVMYAGNIIERAPADELFANPQHPYTQGLLASTPRANKRRKLDPIPGNVPDLTNISYACHFAPRCPESTAECYDVEPEFRSMGPDHVAACLQRDPEVSDRE